MCATQQAPFIKQRLSSFVYAIRGVQELLRSETNARIHLGISCFVLAFGILLSLPAGEWSLVVLAMGLVWTAEAVNTAIERAVDLKIPEIHDLAAQVKDLAAAAVLLASIAASAVGVIVFLPRVLAWLG